MARAPGAPPRPALTIPSNFIYKALKSASVAVAALLMTLAQARADTAGVKGVAVLIPGTFHVGLGSAESILGARLNPFFSAWIIKSLASQGLAVEVVRSIVPLAGLEQNGELALQEIRAWYERNYPAGDVPITLVGHGAGGFFALYAAAHAGDLPIRRVVTLATPMNGLQLADEAFNSGWVGRKLKEICDHADGWIDLQGLPALTSPEVSRFLERIRLPVGTEVIHIAGSQPRPNLFHLTDAAFLSPVLALTSEFIKGASDGLVSVRSAYGGKTPILNTQGGQVSEIVRKDLFMPLDHAKQVLDYRIFATLDESDTDLIAFLQIQVYTAIGSMIASPLSTPASDAP